ncbi:MAG: hypothetical protein WC515_01800 [Candidatus Omnitrophota bacterium]
MGARYGKSGKKVTVYTANIDTFIERLRKVRALNCEPSDVGMDNYMFKRFTCSKLNIATK